MLLGNYDEILEDVIVDGVSMAQYCSSIHYGYHKIWGKDTGRNNGGDNSGTLLGIYPKITFTFHKKETRLIDIINQFSEKYFGIIEGYKSAVISNRKREYYV